MRPDCQDLPERESLSNSDSGAGGLVSGSQSVHIALPISISFIENVGVYIVFYVFFIGPISKSTVYILQLCFYF